MDVLYDSREQGSHVPPLREWLATYPRLADALQTCSLRFIINLPEDCLTDAPRLCFELQEAYWFYLDYLYEGAKRELPDLNQMQFCNLMLESCDLLRAIYKTEKDAQRLISSWREYYRKVPLRGAIILNATLEKCLMVQPWKGEKWTYPRGKINEGETESECAVREIWEEVGLDISDRISESDYVMADIYGSSCPVKLFLIPGVSEEVRCAPNTRREISKIAWVALTKLPGWLGEGRSGSALRFVAVDPFVPQLRAWIEAHTSAGRQPQQQQRGRAATAQQGASTQRRRGVTGGSVAVGQDGGGDTGAAWQGGGGWTEGARGGSRPPERERRRRKQQPRRNEGQQDVFTLDMARVMRAFDRGWDAKPSKGRP